MQKKNRFLIPTASQCVCLVHLFVTLWIVAQQAPVFMGFSRQEYRSGLPCPALGDLPAPGMQLASPMAPVLQVDSLPLSRWGSPTSSLYM